MPAGIFLMMNRMILVFTDCMTASPEGRNLSGSLRIIGVIIAYKHIGLDAIEQIAFVSVPGCEREDAVGAYGGRIDFRVNVRMLAFGIDVFEPDTFALLFG